MLVLTGRTLDKWTLSITRYEPNPQPNCATTLISTEANACETGQPAFAFFANSRKVPGQSQVHRQRLSARSVRVKNTDQLPQYYRENTHPAIIDRETWALVQLKIERQKQFVKTHSMDKFHHHSEAIPLSGKIFCQDCLMIAVKV